MGSEYANLREETRNTLLAAAARIRPVLEANADEAEKLATLPLASVEALQQSGLLAMKLPRGFGGAEADPVAQMETIEAVSYADSSAGWCLMIGATSIALPAVYLPDEALSHIFDKGRIPTASSTVMPAGEANPVDGGYHLTGTWQFASGIRHAEWIVAGARQPGMAGGPSRRLLVVMPTSDVEIHDNWDVAGLKGTGSCAFSARNLFVPGSYAWVVSEDRPRRGGPLYNLGLLGFVTNEHSGFALGVARRALDEIIQTAAQGRGEFRPAGLVERGSFQRELGRSDLQLRAARQLAVAVHEKAWSVVCDMGQPDSALLAEMRGTAAYVTEVAREVVSRAFHYGGGAALYQSSHLQRCLRDIHAASQHLLMSDAAYENHGQFILGLPGAHPMG